MGASEDIAALRDKGLRHMKREEFQKAERIFKKLARTDPNPTIRNNWAACRFYQSDPKGALRLLRPSLEADLPNPFARPRGASPCSVRPKRRGGDATREGDSRL